MPFFSSSVARRRSSFMEEEQSAFVLGSKFRRDRRTLILIFFSSLLKFWFIASIFSEVDKDFDTVHADQLDKSFLCKRVKSIFSKASVDRDGSRSYGQRGSETYEFCEILRM